MINMNYKLKLSMMAILSLVISVAIYATSHFTTIGTIIFSFGSALFLVFLILRYTKESIFHTWKRFAIPYLVLSVVALLFQDMNRDYLFDTEMISMFLAVIFLVISIVLIVYKTHKLKKADKLK